jgi:hypothetical protein
VRRTGTNGRASHPTDPRSADGHQRPRVAPNRPTCGGRAPTAARRTRPTHVRRTGTNGRSTHPTDPRAADGRQRPLDAPDRPACRGGSAPDGGRCAEAVRLVEQRSCSPGTRRRRSPMTGAFGLARGDLDGAEAEARRALDQPSVLRGAHPDPERAADTLLAEVLVERADAPAALRLVAAGTRPQLQGARAAGRDRARRWRRGVRSRWRGGRPSRGESNWDAARPRRPSCERRARAPRRGARRSHDPHEWRGSRRLMARRRARRGRRAAPRAQPPGSRRGRVAAAGRARRSRVRAWVAAHPAARFGVQRRVGAAFDRVRRGRHLQRELARRPRARPGAPMWTGLGPWPCSWARDPGGR